MIPHVFPTELSSVVRPTTDQSSHRHCHPASSLQTRGPARQQSQKQRPTDFLIQDWHKVLTWQSKPARIAVWEAVLRAASCPHTLPNMQRVIEITTGLVKEQLSNASPSSLAAHLSLITTLRKTLTAHTDMAAESAQTSRRQADLLVQQACMPSKMLENLFSLLVDVLSKLHELSTAHRVVPSGQRSSGAACSTPVVRGLRQLAAVLVMGHMKMLNSQLREIFKHAAWHKADPSILDQERFHLINTYDLQLAEIAVLLMLPYPTAMREQCLTADMHSKLQARLWERYALMHFDGRLLPGCCHLECNNLAGVSEAALVTKLCGGCKRVRYCSVACQQAAWLAGGHGSVCGKGGWAV